MPMKKTITEAFIILLITVLLTLAYCVVSPLGRILLKKGLRITTVEVTLVTVTAGWNGI
jgi:hypothetical protein